MNKLIAVAALVAAMLALACQPSIAFNVALINLHPGSTAHVVQSGDWNTALVAQQAAGQDAVVAQSGNSNVASVEQHAPGVTTVSVTQQGSSNTASVSTSGAGSTWVAVGQVGSGNHYSATVSVN